jgi:GNAT superfamily N-acetyltransferase
MKKYTFSKHVKFRREKENILICDCKNLKDFKVKIPFENFLNRITRGVVEADISDEIEMLLFQDFKSTNLLVEITIKPLLFEEYVIADAFLEKQLYYTYNGKRPRSYEFLLDKLHENPELFLGLYLDDDLIGVVEGFPRDDYLLISEIAVDIRFRNKGFGTLLIKEFEKVAKKIGYKKIKLGSQDDAVNLYLKNNYLPLLLIQILDSEYDAVIDHCNKETIQILSTKHFDNIMAVELVIDKIDLGLLKHFKKLFNPISIQYLFTKNLC